MKAIAIGVLTSAAWMLLFALAFGEEGTVYAALVPKTNGRTVYSIPTRVRGDVDVCAEYFVAAAPRQPSRACKSLADVQKWILENAKEDQP